MEKAITGLILFAGLVNFMPLAGVLGAAKLEALYGLPIAGDLAILMRHRAVLFGLTGGFMLLAAFKLELRPYAYAMGFISMLSFIALAYTAGDFNAQIRKIVMVDVVALAALGVALLLDLTRRA